MFSLFGWAQGASGSLGDGVPELVILLAGGPTAPTPQEVVDAVNNQTPLPGSLGSGSPSAARFLLSDRAQGDFLAWLQANAAEPRAILERYVIFKYPATAELGSVEQALAGDANVLYVEQDGYAEFSVSPNDPLFPQLPGQQGPQWGLHAMNLPAAWDWTTGHGYVGVPDSGLEIQTPDCPAVGAETGHPDLRAFHSGAFAHGNSRRRLSKDVGNPNQPDLCVDELQVEELVDTVPGAQFGVTDFAGHGTHVTGIIAATTNNATGVAGTGWHNSIMFVRTAHLVPCTSAACGSADVSQVQSNSDIAEGITWLVDHGAQVINMSFGGNATCSTPAWAALCAAITYADSRDVVMSAASGNSGGAIQFPARDPRVIAVGGAEFPDDFWDDVGFGSSHGPEQDLAAPAKAVTSTFYTAQVWNPGTGCADSGWPTGGSGYGLCTGTSMAAPHIAGLAGILRSVDPLLTKTEVQHSLQEHASQSKTWDQFMGYGIPNALASTQAMLGSVAGRALRNRATPVFTLYSDAAKDYFYTTVPQMASGAIQDTAGVAYASVGPVVPGYSSFPGCTSGSCPSGTPRASVYALSTELHPAPGSGLLTPLYRLSRFAAFGSNPNHRDHHYAISDAEVQSAFTAGYYLDGVEGYIYPTCGTNTDCTDISCQPPGTVPLLRRRNTTVDDHAIFPASELGSAQYSGYTQVVDSRACLGWVYPNADGDGDSVIDGFEDLIGTDPLADDSDCDGDTDDEELLGYPRTDAIGGQFCVGDAIFANGFESGGLAQWSSAETSGSASLQVEAQSDLIGIHSCNASVSGGAADAAYVRDNTPASEARYRARFYLQHGDLQMGEGESFYLLVGRSGSVAILRLVLRFSGGGFQAQTRALLDNATWATSGWVAVPDSSALEIEWRAASSSSASNGYVKLWVNAALASSMSGLDTDQQRVEAALLGVVSGVDPGTVGTLVVDGFESRRTTFIGLAQ